MNTNNRGPKGQFEKKNQGSSNVGAGGKPQDQQQSRPLDQQQQMQQQTGSGAGKTTGGDAHNSRKS